MGSEGGIVAIVGAVLPWWNVSASSGGISLSVPILGIFWIGGILCLVFGILGLIFAMLKSPAFGLVTAVMGLLVVVIAAMYGAFLPTGSVSAGQASASITPGFGYWISMLGGILLLAAGPLVFMDNRKAAAAPPAPMMMPPGA